MKKKALAIALAFSMTFNVSMPILAEPGETEQVKEDNKGKVNTEKNVNSNEMEEIEKEDSIENKEEIQVQENSETASSVENYNAGDNFKVGVLNYQVNEDANSCTVTGCDKDANGELEIPESVNGYLVTKIGDY